MADRSLRLDRWLWFTRFYKTRTAASKAVNGGHVRLNGERARTSSESAAKREQRVSDLRADRLQMAMTPGKPDKRTRRKLRDRNRGEH